MLVISAKACSEIVRTFDNQGWHRTATEVDQQSGQWLVRSLQAIGLDARAIPFPFGRVDASESSVSAGSFQVSAVHLMDSTLPPPNTTVRGFFGPGSVHLVQTEPHGVASGVEGARRGNFDAIVVAVAGEREGTALLNAWNYDNPGGAPVVQVPAAAWGDLVAARDAGLPVEVRCGGTRTEMTAFNVFATIPGSRGDKAPIVMLTPRSGWWHCAGERGGGLAIWLEVARIARELSLERDLVLLATTGHELGFVGVKRYFDAEPELARRAIAWIHLGANIGAMESQLMVRASDAALLALVRDVATDFRAIAPAPVVGISDRPVGEAGEVFVRGGRFVSLVGAGFPLFHSTLDRWPQAINTTAIVAAGHGVLQIIGALDREP